MRTTYNVSLREIKAIVITKLFPVPNTYSFTQQITSLNKYAMTGAPFKVSVESTTFGTTFKIPQYKASFTV